MANFRSFKGMQCHGLQNRQKEKNCQGYEPETCVKILLFLKIEATFSPKAWLAMSDKAQSPTPKSQTEDMEEKG